MNLEIAERLTNLRKEKGYSQEELAAQLGISRQAISKWERGEASPDTDNLILLSKIYGIGLDELLNIDGFKDAEEGNNKKKLVKFPYPVLVTIIYLILGFSYKLWHPGWILYLTVPIFYYVAVKIDRSK
ncbi:helix-turn-helix transcriptional regulator [Anaerosalibacter bizertensis]|uniref:Helix-turn-helix transcriptional regulator n=1 Tax=Anaerosalibacter bizertensis TaxID=932217 RepID=A0A844FF29_9FIRM|nr:helix-turn-helix transcriptional regulator [Anaerosalibacter bizertensis]MBU5292456.1 helix-turn-helix domain-containing protein [Anaerosalibacter bizertensis]MSS42604.1 helix-turn-helix transcriptional regulator [Anaerosalibacter bizertensis]